MFEDCKEQTEERETQEQRDRARVRGRQLSLTSGITDVTHSKAAYIPPCSATDVSMLAFSEMETSRKQMHSS